IGSTDHLLRRFQQHRAGYSAATRGRGPWWMPYYEIHTSLAAARHRESELKRKKSQRSLQALIRQLMI
ncbi:MAG: GIY-YIG nuclease family protein, partial [Verrucomicrobia bacterium]|nr:GIY-YIG nuclease family protein [Verrucomicrobiota bacterium]